MRDILQTAREISHVGILILRATHATTVCSVGVVLAACLEAYSAVTVSPRCSWRTSAVNARSSNGAEFVRVCASVEDGVIREAQAMPIRYSLGALLVFGAVNAFGGGYYGLSGAKGVPTEWLNGSPFPDYFVPSLILLVVVGGSFIVAATAVFTGLRIARLAALTAGIVVLGWLAVQLAIIGYVSWMQPTTAIAGVLVLVLGSLLPQAQ